MLRVAGAFMKLFFSMIYAESSVRDSALSSKRRGPPSDGPILFQLLFRWRRTPAQARAEFQNALRLNPYDFKAHGNSAGILAEHGGVALADSLHVDSDESLAQDCLNELLKAQAVPKTRN